MRGEPPPRRISQPILLVIKNKLRSLVVDDGDPQLERIDQPHNCVDARCHSPRLDPANSRSGNTCDLGHLALAEPTRAASSAEKSSPVHAASECRIAERPRPPAHSLWMTVFAPVQVAISDVVVCLHACEQATR